jgi:hypothetical protein
MPCGFIRCFKSENYMTSASVNDTPPSSYSMDAAVSLTRLYILRFGFLVMTAPGIFLNTPELLNPDPAGRGVLSSVLLGLWLVCFLGLRYPLQMLPIFLFEFIWKTIWLVSYGAPQWLAGKSTPQFQEDIIMIGAASIVFALVIPWDHVYRCYIKRPGDRWR